MDSDIRYPLHWPDGRPRTAPSERRRASFNTSQADATSGLMNELRLLKADNIILSTNVKLRRDGLPYASERPPADPGVALYFQHKGKPVAMDCDCWDRVGDNIHSINKTVNAFRGIKRWGASEMTDRAFRGFVGIPQLSGNDDWWTILELHSGASPQQIEQAWRRLRKRAHSDHGGSNEEFNKLQAAYQEAQRSVTPAGGGHE